MGKTTSDKTFEKNVIIKNKAGLHARPAAIFVQIANKFDSEIIVKKGAQEVNGKSIMGILMLAARQGQTLVIKANGPDADLAILELEKILTKEVDKKNGK